MKEVYLPFCVHGPDITVGTNMGKSSSTSFGYKSHISRRGAIWYSFVKNDQPLHLVSSSHFLAHVWLLGMFQSKFNLMLSLVLMFFETHPITELLMVIVIFAQVIRKEKYVKLN